ncbi:MAG: hypothetical protein C4520_07970 [Candidatus Abyssobacteria bacterium SURF_5]|uniref:4Fe-4S ferredoxin-type domain-containing protein n=1 Tax=Abyssobacteria bacterium (strain SURF_5) TaxID=2093360 RepID=A0A3A4P3G7_ABYX5|nr:MAG: hypothetical protein C4520_07970 [Candidatus Abyssubacteria bacterium SURF_5]
MPFGKPVTQSRCGQCAACVRACPYGAIKGADWRAGLERKSMIAPFLCSRRREQFRPQLGYKHPCGLCINYTKLSS